MEGLWQVAGRLPMIRRGTVERAPQRQDYIVYRSRSGRIRRRVLCDGAQKQGFFRSVFRSLLGGSGVGGQRENTARFRLGKEESFVWKIKNSARFEDSRKFANMSRRTITKVDFAVGSSGRRRRC